MADKTAALNAAAKEWRPVSSAPSAATPVAGEQPEATKEEEAPEKKTEEVQGTAAEGGEENAEPGEKDAEETPAVGEKDTEEAPAEAAPAEAAPATAEPTAEPTTETTATATTATATTATATPAAREATPPAAEEEQAEAGEASPEAPQPQRRVRSLRPGGNASAGRWERGARMAAAREGSKSPNPPAASGGDQWNRGARVSRGGAEDEATPAADDWRVNHRTVASTEAVISASGRVTYPADALLQLRPMPGTTTAPEHLELPPYGDPPSRPPLLRSEVSDPAPAQDRGGNRAFGGKPQNGSNGQNGHGRRGNGHRRGREQETAPALEDCEPLAINEETRWKAKVMGGTTTAEEDAAFDRRVRALLNKLTLELFDKISKQIIALVKESIASESQLSGFANAVVLKAQDEHHFCAMYAELCRTIALEPILDDSPKKPKNFKAALLVRCQEEFDEDLASRLVRAEARAEEEKLDEEDRGILLIKTKRQYLGHMKFLGELFLKGLLKEKIVHEVIGLLLHDGGEHDEERLECLCKLLSTVGHRLEFATQKLKYREVIGLYFEELVKLGEDESLPSRTRFMCRDVVELRQNNYASRRQEEVAKTISEVRAEAAAELAQKDKGGRNGRGKKPTMQRSASMPENSTKMAQMDDGWNTAANTGVKNSRSSARAPAAVPLQKANSASMFSMLNMDLGDDVSTKKKKKKDKKEKEEKKKKKKRTVLSPTAASTAASTPDLTPTASPRNSPPPADAESARRGAWAAVEEFAVGRDEEELLRCLGECANALGHAGGAWQAASEVLGKSFEARSNVRDSAVAALGAAAAANTTGFDSENLARAIAEQLEMLWDFKIDIPRIEDYMVGFIGPLLGSGGVTLEALQAAPEAFRRPDTEFHSDADPLAFAVRCLVAAGEHGGDARALAEAFDFSTVAAAEAEDPNAQGMAAVEAALA